MVSSWKVGLISISLPDLKVHLPKSVDSNEILFTMDWIMKYPSGALKFGRAHYDPKDLRTLVKHIDGDIFRTAVHLELPRPHLGSSNTASDGKRMPAKFRWDGNDLQTDNKVTKVRAN